jgi:hypothetical protein
VIYRRTAGCNRARLLPSQRLSLPLFGRDIAAKTDVELKYKDRVGPKAARKIRDDAVYTGDDGAHCDDRSGSDHHTKDG